MRISKILRNFHGEEVILKSVYFDFFLGNEYFQLHFFITNKASGCACSDIKKKYFFICLIRREKDCSDCTSNGHILSDECHKTPLLQLFTCIEPLVVLGFVLRRGKGMNGWYRRIKVTDECV